MSERRRVRRHLRRESSSTNVKKTWERGKSEVSGISEATTGRLMKKGHFVNVRKLRGAFESADRERDYLYLGNHRKSVCHSATFSFSHALCIEYYLIFINNCFKSIARLLCSN